MEIWRLVAPLLSPAIDVTGGRTDMGEVFRRLRAGQHILWVARDDDGPVVAAFTTRVAQYPLKRMLVVDACGGSEMGEWLAVVVDTFRRFARDSGLDGVEMYGRAGWARALRRYGWRSPLVLCEIDVADAQQENNL